ncbi:MAG: CinA family protein [Proteobacteria bacterium]|nr:CinA family protein [Pseudomonadota bacterium]
MFPSDMIDRATALLNLYHDKGLMLATAESCTGGLIMACLTAIAGSSATVERGFVTYSNEAKNEAIGVDMNIINTHGAVSEPVAGAMALGALAHSRADAAVSVTGVAGPGGGTPEKPVGLVYIGGARLGTRQPYVERHLFEGDRNDVRHATVLAAFAMLEKLANHQEPEG